MAKQGSRRGTAEGRRGKPVTPPQAQPSQAQATQAHPAQSSARKPSRRQDRDSARLVSGLRLGFAVALLVLILANFLVRPTGHFGIDGSFAFFAWFSFLACIGLIVVAKVLGVFLKRRPDYYDQPPGGGTDLAAPAAGPGQSREQGQ